MKVTIPEEKNTSEKIIEIGRKSESIARRCLLSVCMLFFSALTWYCIRYTWLESEGIPYDTKDHSVINVLILTGVFFFISAVYQIAKRRTVHQETGAVKTAMTIPVICCALLTYIIAALWVSYCHISPSGDGMSLCAAAHRMHYGIYVDMIDNGYLLLFPHQYGLLSVIRLIFRVFGIMNYKVFQHINALCIPLLFVSGYKIVRLIYDKAGAVLCYMILFITCLPMFFYVPFVYGEIISITFTMVFMWQVIRFCKTGKKDSFLWGTAAILIACFVRSNSLIVLIAAGIVLIFHAVREAKLRGIIWLLAIVLLVSGSHKLVNYCYEKESGIKIESGIPSVSWVRMGLGDTRLGPGWFDNSSIETFAANGYDTEKTTLAEKEQLRIIINGMLENKAGTVDFFKRKILSQWNSPGYRYLYETSHFDCEPDELPELVRKIYFDDQNKVQLFLNIYQLFIYFFATVLTLLLSVDKKSGTNLADCLLFIAITGGFLFTIMWESGSRYVLPYFVYMLPLAAMGMRRLSECCDKLFSKHKKEASPL